MADARANAHRAIDHHLVITRADGTTLDLGRVDYWHRNPLRRAWWRLWGLPRSRRRIRAANQQAARAARNEEA
ncbi:hypothetical protein [Streptomyces sp. NPDC019937]|uniref:hypothetical protein n=1 Tax=Streptomyces sp. NPDC019937 TaxID=3154787 RepID=UPI0033D92287